MSASMTKALWDKVDAHNLTTEELKAFAQAEELAYSLGHLARTVSGIACLVTEDGQNKTGAGNFQHSTDVADLLFAISDAIGTKAELVNIASTAAWMLGEKQTPS